MENEKEAIGLAAETLAEVAGGMTQEVGIKPEMGVRLEHGEWFEQGNSLFIYEGPTTFVPLMETIQVDVYAKSITIYGGVFYDYMTQFPFLAMQLDASFVHSSKEPIPYELRK